MNYFFCLKKKKKHLNSSIVEINMKLLHLLVIVSGYICKYGLAANVQGPITRNLYASARAKLNRPIDGPDRGSSEPLGTQPANSPEREQLFEAYNMLHSLAQDFKKPFDSPAVLVVGHQTSGKSALLEALMGFQFNQVGLELASEIVNAI